MRFRWMLLALFAFATAAHAFDTYRIGSRLIRIGDSASELIALAGEPIYKEPIETRGAGFLGERWQYRLDGKTIMFTIRAGRVDRIEEIRDQE